MARSIEQQLIATALPYWEAEGEIARRFFARAGRDDHIFYLRAQLWKELNPVDGYFNGLHRELARLVEMFPRVGKDIDRHDFHYLLMQLTQEFNHFVVLADILEFLLGRKIRPADLIQLPEEKRLGDLRRRLVKSGNPVARAAVGLTEGGGARLFRAGARLKGSKLNRMTAAAMRVIYDDEKDHYAEAAKEAARAVKTKRDLAAMKQALAAVSAQRVAMRNEMFRAPMTKAEIARFIARKRRA
jgi:hypothetical protein